VLGALALLWSYAPASDASHIQDPSLEAILERLARYRHNQDHDTVLELQAYIRDHRQAPAERQECERQLLGFLGGDATLDGKWEACRQLRSIGSDASVSILSEMLIREDTSEMARYALEKVPGSAVDRVFLGALKTSSDKIRLGIISSLGHRGSRAAVADLSRIAAGPDPAAAEAAVLALGGIATEDAAHSLVPLLGSDRERLVLSAAGSILKCAETLRAAGEAERAFPLYRQLLGSDISEPVSRAALQGLIAVSGDQGKGLILDVLKNEDMRMHSAAIGMIPLVFADSDLLPLCELLPRLPVQSRIQMISALSGYRNDMVLVSMIQALSSPELHIRLAALQAVQKQGSPTTAKILARHAAQSRGVEQAAARSALWNLKGRAVDDAILAALSEEGEPALERELVRSVGERRIAEGKPPLYESLESPDAGIRLEAVRALGHLTGPEDIPFLIDRLLELEDEAEQNALSDTLASAARRISRPYARAGLVTNRLSETDSADDRRILLMVLGRIGDDSSLRFLRQALGDPDSAIQEAAARALIDWPTAAARDDVFWLAETSTHPTLQVLAVRAFIRMVEMERFRRPEAAVDSLRAVLPLVRRPEEKMAVLSVLPRFPCPAALELAESFLEDAGVEKEARAAAARLRRSLR
jgi:HEAT repeat protein